MLRTLLHPIKTRHLRRLAAQLDEYDPIEHAFQALVILESRNVPAAPKQKLGGAK